MRILHAFSHLQKEKSTLISHIFRGENFHGITVISCQFLCSGYSQHSYWMKFAFNVACELCHEYSWRSRISSVIFSKINIGSWRQDDREVSCLLQPNINLFPCLKKLRIPTLILHGKQDIVPVWTAQEIKNAIPQSEIVVLDHCNHFPYIEQPSQFFIQLTRFLRKLEP